MAAIYACPNYTDDGIHSDYGYLDTYDNPHLIKIVVYHGSADQSNQPNPHEFEEISSHRQDYIYIVMTHS